MFADRAAPSTVTANPPRARNKSFISLCDVSVTAVGWRGLTLALSQGVARLGATNEVY